nr:hypothetical protein [Caballeronia sp. dw_276]
MIADAQNVELTESTRVRAAFDAIYCCSPQSELLEQSLALLRLNAEDASLVNQLAEWVLKIAPLEPLPMSPAEAVALAARVHRVVGSK